MLLIWSLFNNRFFHMAWEWSIGQGDTPSKLNQANESWGKILRKSKGKKMQDLYFRWGWNGGN